jgi:hypothetical protein
LRRRLILSYDILVLQVLPSPFKSSAARLWARALAAGAGLAVAACGGAKGPATVKPPSAYRLELCAATENINLFLSENTPANTARDELQQTVGELARAYPKIAAEAAPLRGKTGDPGYGAVAIGAEDGVIVAGNLAAALAADPAKLPDAAPKLKAAIADWVAYNDGLAGEGGEVAFEPKRWWDAPAWRDAAAAGR